LWTFLFLCVEKRRISIGNGKRRFMSPSRHAFFIFAKVVKASSHFVLFSFLPSLASSGPRFRSIYDWRNRRKTKNHLSAIHRSNQ
jgi:hypothetical protein